MPILEHHDTTVRVRYAETDQMGVAYHSNHLIWFEVGRVEFLRQMGFSYRDMERVDGLFIAVAEVHCRYRAPVHYDEEVLVRTRLKHVRKSVVVFRYELARAEGGALLAEGETTHVVTDATMKAAALPEKYLKAFRKALGKAEMGGNAKVLRKTRTQGSIVKSKVRSPRFEV
jgi:acyl-CoA thioester hydrolase